MRKLYSLVLIAAGLLIGTNSWAANTTVSQLQDAFDDATTTEFVLQSDADNLTFTSQLVLDKDKYMVLDLNGLTLKMDVAKKAAIVVKRGRLEIKNGTIENNNLATNDLVRVYGTTATGTDAELETPYSQVIVANTAILKNEKQKLDTKFNALVITETGTEKLANGARIDVYGKAKGRTYGIKVNGNVKEPADRSDAPFVYVHANSEVTSMNDSSSVAIYASGFARWRIEGNCQGNTGLYAKGGTVDITGNANIESTADAAQAASTGKTSGIAAGGSAIVIESNAAYPGQISVTISGNSTITGTKGYAIEETVADAVEGTKVESISIQGGTITGGDAGAIIVDAATKGAGNVQVVGGEFEGVAKVDGTTVETVAISTFVPGTTTDDDTDEDKDFLVTGAGTEANPIVVTPNTSKVITLNAYGYATFSAAKARAIKADDKEDLKAYTATFNGEYTLGLTEYSGVIYANSGVVFIGTPNKTYALLADDSEADALPSALKPAAEWSSAEAVNGIITGQVHENAYVLSGNMMYKYEGANMKANKAYLDLGTGSGAPKRIRMVVTETEETQAVENIAPEAVKAVKFVGNDGKLYIRRGEAVYTVQGQLVK